MELIIAILQAIILGIVEGITEFLPISSTGHLIVFEHLIGFDTFNKEFIEMFTYIIQLGAILAVIFLYKDKIKDTLVNFFPKGKGDKDSGFMFWLTIFVACIPGLFVELFFGSIFDEYFFNPFSVAVALLVGGILMLLVEKKFRNKNGSTRITLAQGFVIGCFQCLAIFPGMSRSASTIIGAWILGVTTVTAAEFSFFLAIPVLAGMSGLKIIKYIGEVNMGLVEYTCLAIGFIVSFIVALIVIKKFIAYLQNKSMRPFAVYRILFSFIIMGLLFVKLL